MAGKFEIRCPIYGFIPLDSWEYEIISQPAFQRLRRIRQLAWTDYVYPGAMHTRFEHSLGVMHMATQLYNGVLNRSEKVLRDDLGYQATGDARYRKLVRIAALLHDVGHAPFSHASEELLPSDGSVIIKHEQYTTAIIRKFFKEVIEDHPENVNFFFRVDDVCALIEGTSGMGKATRWREIISGHLELIVWITFCEMPITPVSIMAGTIGGGLSDLSN